MTMTGEKLLSKLGLEIKSKPMKDELLKEVINMYENYDNYYELVKQYAEKNNLAIDEDTVRNDMFEKLYVLQDEVKDDREKELIGDMAWDLVGDNQIINYGLCTVVDILNHKKEFLQANKEIIEIASKDYAESEEDFGDYSNEYLTENWSRMYEILEENICGYEKHEGYVIRKFANSLEKKIKGVINETIKYKNITIEIIDITKLNINHSLYEIGLKEYGFYCEELNPNAMLETAIDGEYEPENSPYIWCSAMIKCGKEYSIVHYDFFDKVGLTI